MALDYEDLEIRPLYRYSSSDVIAAAEELKFKTHTVSIKVNGKYLLSETIQYPQSLTNDELEKTFSTSISNGLSSKQVKQKLKQFGLNILPIKRPYSWWQKLILYFFCYIVDIFSWICCILLFILYAYTNHATNVCFSFVSLFQYISNVQSLI